MFLRVRIWQACGGSLILMGVVVFIYQIVHVLVWGGGDWGGVVVKALRY